MRHLVASSVAGSRSAPTWMTTIPITMFGCVGIALTIATTANHPLAIAVLTAERQGVFRSNVAAMTDTDHDGQKS